MDQCGIPKMMALELFRPYVYAGLMSWELAANMRVARRMVEELDPQVWDVLESVVKDRPVLLNRAPTLHRLGIQAFYPILVENKAKHDVKPTHSLEDLIKLTQLLPDRLVLFMVYYKDKPIAGSSVFICNETVTLCFYNMLIYEYEHLKPIHRVMYEVVKWSTEKGYKYVDIGVSQDTKAANPMTPSMNLIDFKEKFDAKTVMRNTLHKKL